MLERVGLLDERGAAGHRRRARTGSRRSSRRARSRSRRPTKTSTPRSSVASPRSRARPAPSCTPAAAATTRSRSTCGCTSGAKAACRPRASTSSKRCCCAGPKRPTDVYLPGYTHLQRGAAGAARASPARALLGARPRRRPLARLPRARRRVAARRRRARRFEPAARSRSSSPTSSASRGRSTNSLDAVSDRDFVAEALFVGDAHAGAPVAPRRGDRAVVDRGVRLPAPRRRVLHRLVDAAAEEEPRHRRARAGQGRPPDRRPRRLPRDPEGASARVQPRSPRRQGAAVRRARHVRALAARALRADGDAPSSSTRA